MSARTPDAARNYPRRLRACVEAWPECAEGEYSPSCCRFPKSCSCNSPCECGEFEVCDVCQSVDPDNLPTDKPDAANRCRAW